LDKTENPRGVSMKKNLFINKPTYEMLEFISKKNGKNISSFLDSWALQEYEEYQSKPFKKTLKR
jgi:hypothetical protein